MLKNLILRRIGWWIRGWDVDFLYLFDEVVRCLGINIEMRKFEE